MSKKKCAKKGNGSSKYRFESKATQVLTSLFGITGRDTYDRHYAIERPGSRDRFRADLVALVRNDIRFGAAVYDQATRGQIVAPRTATGDITSKCLPRAVQLVSWISGTLIVNAESEHDMKSILTAPFLATVMEALTREKTTETFSFRTPTTKPGITIAISATADGRLVHTLVVPESRTAMVPPDFMVRSGRTLAHAGL